jgi:integrating conjugative element protein (TIGR03749 family)
MTHKQGLCLTLMLFCMTSLFASSVEHVIWDKTPIHITLPLNEERLIRFPNAISVVDSELDEHVSVMKIQDALYFNAQATFENKRLVVQLMPNGEAIVLSISAKKDAKNATPIEVVLEPRDNTDTPNPSPSTDINAITLSRFAIQSLYSPERLLVTPPEITRTPMQTHHHITFVYGASITATPLISWHANDLYVTAIELKNNLKKPVIIDPRQLLGHWQTATFYPTNTLLGSAHPETTTVFVTSSRPFGEALMDTREFVR